MLLKGRALLTVFLGLHAPLLPEFVCLLILDREGFHLVKEVSLPLIT